MNRLKNRVITILFLSSFIIAQPTIDLGFGNTFEEEVVFVCAADVIEFNSQQFYWYRVGTDLDECEEYDGQQL